jgi:hypothetical protein
LAGGFDFLTTTGDSGVLIFGCGEVVLSGPIGR